MKENIVNLSFGDGVADLLVSGRTPLESKENAQDLISAFKEKDAYAIFRVPDYVGFNTRIQRHTTCVTVVLSNTVQALLDDLEVPQELS